jgi:hypothetical protein
VSKCRPEPLRLKAGLTYRFRLINITPNNPPPGLAARRFFTLRWRAVAKDGMDLPSRQALERDARQVVSVGETFDFEFEPAMKGDLRLEVLRPGNRTLAVAEVQVR